MRTILMNTNSRIMIEGIFLNDFLNNKGLKHGHPLSIHLFNIVLKYNESSWCIDK